jgi:RNA polymerase subunit RPABC4/transcription elongation factor Spt4
MSTPRGRWLACARCNTLLEPGASFCPNCGQSVPRSEPIGSACPHCTAINLPGAAYCETCGAALPSRPYLVVLNSGLRLHIFSGDQTAVVAGRSDALSGVAPDLDLEPYAGELAGLSRHHARLTLRDGQCWIEDLNSVNWTYLNNQRLSPERPAPLKDGDLLRLGNVVLTFHVG